MCFCKDVVAFPSLFGPYARSPRSALSHPFLGEGSPTKIDHRKRRYPYSNLCTGGPRYIMASTDSLSKEADREAREDDVFHLLKICFIFPCWFLMGSITTRTNFSFVAGGEKANGRSLSFSGAMPEVHDGPHPRPQSQRPTLYRCRATGGSSADLFRAGGAA